MDRLQEHSRWRDLQKPLSPLDAIVPDGPHYVEGHIPAGFIVLLYDGQMLRGPMRFQTQQEADDYLIEKPGVIGYLIIPRYDA